MGERTITGNKGRRRHAVQGAGTSGGGRRVVGVVNVQVGGVFHWRSRWGAGDKREGFGDERLCMVRVGRKEEGKEQSVNW